MRPAALILLIVYVLAVLADLLFIVLKQDYLRWITKPLLMPLLMLFFYLGSLRKSRLAFWLILTALFLSWCGDVLLQAKDLFIPGLVSFLLAHCAYIGYFYQIDRTHKGFLRKKPLLVLPVVGYVSLLLYWLFPYLGPMKIPVIVYSLAIGTMLLMAINSWSAAHRQASFFFMTGALLFVLSDSLLAINLFATKKAALGPFVMITYAAAQYLLIRGALKRQETL